VWGFPSTSLQQPKYGARVVVATDEMLVLSEPLDPGFSGGPVLSSNRLLGWWCVPQTANHALCPPR